MPYHLVWTSHFMFWSIVQLLLHVCLGRVGTIEESIRTKRVISYLKNPKSDDHSSDFSRYERKKVVETFHHIVKKILSPYPKNETDYTDSKASHISLGDQKRREIEIPKSFDYEDGVLSESGGYSVKVLDDPSETSSDAQMESFYDGGSDDILMERPKRAIKRSPLSEGSNWKTTNISNGDSEDYYRRVRNVWKRVEEIISKKKVRKSNSLNRRIRRKRKWVDEDDDDSSDDDDDEEETQIESGIGLEDDRVRLLSLLPLLPMGSSDTTNDDDDSDGGALKFLFLCIFGALSLLGIAILIMGIYSAAITNVRGGDQVENFKRTCLGLFKGIRESWSQDSLSERNSLEKIETEKNSKKKETERNSETEGPRRNTEDVHVLMRTFVNVLSKRPSRSLNQKYGSKTHIKAVNRISRRKR